MSSLNKILLCHLFIILLVGSLFSPWTSIYWEKIDLASFHFLNRSLEIGKGWQLFWGFVNHRLHNWVEDLFFLGFFLLYIFQAPKEARLRAVSHCLFIVLFSSCIIYLVNCVLFRELFIFYRESPSLVTTSKILLSDKLPWLHIKESSYRSFPSDHGVTALLFAFSYTYYSGWRLGRFAWGYAAFLCLPRLVIGAHWLSDIVVGSGSIALFFLSWIFFTPFYRACALPIEKGVAMLYISLSCLLTKCTNFLKKLTSSLPFSRC